MNRTVLADMAHIPIMNKTLKIAEPTIVPVPISDLAISTPIIEVKSSGADVPALKNNTNLKNSNLFSISIYIYSHKSCSCYIFF